MITVEKCYGGTVMGGRMWGGVDRANGEKEECLG